MRRVWSGTGGAMRERERLVRGQVLKWNRYMEREEREAERERERERERDVS